MPPSGAAAAEAEGSAADPGQSDADFGWDAAPTYHFVRRVPKATADLPLPEARRFDISGRIGGSLFLDAGLRRGQIPERGWHTEVRRARINTSGLLNYIVKTEYKVEFGVDDGKFYLNDFYGRWRLPRYFDRLRIGYFDPPVSLEVLASSFERSLMEVASPLSAFAPGLRLGIEVDGALEDPSLTYSLNLSSVGQSQQFSDASSSALRGVGRLVWRPDVSESLAPDALVHLAASIGYTFSGSGEIRYRSRPESDLMPYLVDTQDLSGDASTTGLEGAWRSGALTAQVEYLRSRVSRDSDSDVAFSGAYAQLAYTVTGEVRRYDTATATFSGITPEQPFAWSLDRLGALELAARYSWLDLEDENVAGGVMRSLNLGLVWTLNYWTKVELGYVAARTRGNSAEGTSRIFQGRLALRF